MQVVWRLESAQARALGFLAVFVAVAAGAWWWLSAPVQEVSAPLVRVTSVAPAGDRVIVHVIGRVRRPGVVRLPAGARVLDAVVAAGGVLPGVRPTINLARVLVDGEQVVITSVAGVSSPARSTDGRIDLNHADLAALDRLPGIGPVLAQRIIDHRRAHGPFASVQALEAVPGIGSATVDELAAAATTT